MVIIVRNSTGSMIGSGSIAITSLIEYKENVIKVFDNLDSNITGSLYIVPHFVSTHFHPDHFFCGEWRSYQGSGIDYTIQNLNLRNTVYTIKGSITGLTGSVVNGRNTLRAMIGLTGSIESGYISKTPIYYESVTFNDKDIPSEVKFTLKSIEIK